MRHAASGGPKRGEGGVQCPNLQIKGPGRRVARVVNEPFITDALGFGELEMCCLLRCHSVRNGERFFKLSSI